MLRDEGKKKKDGLSEENEMSLLKNFRRMHYFHKSKASFYLAISSMEKVVMYVM